MTSQGAGDVIDAAIEANAVARAELMEAVDALTDACRLEPWFGDEAWSVKDIVAHICRWQDSAAGGLEQIARGERPTVEGYEGDDAAYNAESVRRFSDSSWPQLMEALRRARERHEAAARGLRGYIDPERLEPGKTAHRLLFLPSTHDHEHIPAILEWRRSRGY